jgi:glycosyltransferase involved in cell wall biosynthesis
LTSPSVAVVITTYNHAHFLSDAIESVLTQTHPADEILVVDDGSTDSPRAIAARYPEVRFIRQPNQGLAAARNTGLHSVSSDKVIFLDADDRLLPEAITAGLACFKSAPGSGLIYGGHRRVNTCGAPISGNIYNPISAEPYRDFLRGNAIGMHATVMYNRLRLVDLGGFDPLLRRCEDYDVYLRMSRSFPIASHPTVVADYRQHGANVSSDHSEMLTWALRVHRREVATARRRTETAWDWRRGRSLWKTYYAEQILYDAKSGWAVSRNARSALQVVLRAMAASPQVTARNVLSFARHNLGRTLRTNLSRAIRKLGGQWPPPLRTVRFGDLGGIKPVSLDFGFDRGTPIDRYYIEDFLGRHASDIAGRVLEVGDDTYCRRFGGTRVTAQDVLDVNPDNPTATIVGDLSKPCILPEASFDCLVVTQTLHLIYDMQAAVIQMYRALKPGGVILLTVPGISQLDRRTWANTWFWSLTRWSADRLFSDIFGAANVDIETHGNVFAATAFLQGLAVEEVTTAKLDTVDVAYPVIVAVRAQKSAET